MRHHKQRSVEPPEEFAGNPETNDYLRSVGWSISGARFTHPLIAGAFDRTEAIDMQYAIQEFSRPREAPRC